MTSILLLLSRLLSFSDSLLVSMMDSDPIPLRVGPSVQSGHETQYLVSEGDIRESDADPLVSQPNVGKFIIPLSVKLL